MTKLMTSELSNKLFLRKLFKGKIMLEFNLNFRLENARDFKILKNIIAIELLAGQRPFMIASYVRKSLMVNLKISKTELPELLQLLQKSPVIWKNYLKKINFFEKGFFYPSIANNNMKLSLSIKKMNKLNSWVKSAYLD